MTKAAFTGSKASEPASQISPALTVIDAICRLPAAPSSSYSIGLSLPTKKSLLGTAIEAKVKKRLTDESTMKVFMNMPPGCSGMAATVPSVAFGSAAAKAGNQALPEPPSATVMIGAVATPPRLKASKLPLPKPTCIGAKLMPLAGTRLSSVTLTCTCAACAPSAATPREMAASVRRPIEDRDMSRLLEVGGCPRRGSGARLLHARDAGSRGRHALFTAA